MIVIYDWDGDSVPDHTGLVESVLDDQTFQAIEGNHNDQVQRMHRRRDVVEAFCTLPYEGETPPAAAPQPAAGVPLFPGYCSFGSQDNATRAVQQRLADLGRNLQVDGIFGPDTLRVVKAFQSTKGIDADGVVGPVTWNALWT